MQGGVRWENGLDGLSHSALLFVIAWSRSDPPDSAGRWRECVSRCFVFGARFSGLASINSRFWCVTLEDTVEDARRSSHGEHDGPRLGTPHSFRGLFFATTPMDSRAPVRTSHSTVQRSTNNFGIRDAWRCHLKRKMCFNEVICVFIAQRRDLQYAVYRGKMVAKLRHAPHALQRFSVWLNNEPGYLAVTLVHVL